MSLPNIEMFSEWQDWAAALLQELAKPTAYAPKEPVGKIAIFKAVVGPGYLLCNGSTFSTESYLTLYQFLGVNVLPNLTSPFGASYVVGIKT